MKKERLSNFELLRILCVISILAMHYLGRLGFTSPFQVMLNSFLNVASCVFMLISGYFGINRRISKIVHLELIFIFWNVLPVLISYINGNIPGRQSVINALFPTMSRASWFVSGYMLILIFSPYINDVINISLIRTRNVILLLLMLFCVVPSCLYIDYTGMGGKDLIHLLIWYIIGRYIKLSGMTDKIKQSVSTVKLVIYYVLALGLTVILDQFAELLDLRFAFSRDCSILIIIQAVFLILIFERMSIKSKCINFIAKDVISVILGEGMAIGLLTKAGIDSSRPYVLLLEFLLCILIEKVRGFVSGIIEPGICSVIRSASTKIIQKIDLR